MDDAGLPSTMAGESTLCPSFELAVAEEAAEYCELPELPLVIFYAMLLNEAKRSASRPPRPLPKDFHVLCPCFSLSEAEGTAADFELPKIVQVTFYAMLLNKAVELGVAHDFTAESMKSSLIGLRWSTFEVWMDCVDHALRGAQLHRPADEVEVRGSRDGQEEGTRSADPPAPSNDEE
ncbi:hypothetical protein Cgig2_016916 [Carnegiea gigantea]|uniref:Uncharacterized protein n=1 Tax=Carnegiea gigantea TaxID=171969 RepID=A0A9Q1GSJ1_9CARY|nr:hypothetical protein Cgig2_016916 [Carnegiea gigantea]